MTSLVGPTLGVAILPATLPLLLLSAMSSSCCRVSRLWPQYARSLRVRMPLLLSGPEAHQRLPEAQRRRVMQAEQKQCKVQRSDEKKRGTGARDQSDGEGEAAAQRGYRHLFKASEALSRLSRKFPGRRSRFDTKRQASPESSPR